jgi:hypothetical protein
MNNKLISENWKWSEKRERNINGPTATTKGRPTRRANLSRGMTTKVRDFVNGNGFEKPDESLNLPR